MPATPAWPPASLPRLYVEETLSEGAELTLDGAQANYLANVLRLGPGAQVKLFDDRTGEWLAEIIEAGRKRVTLRLTAHLRPREPVPDLWLLFAPIKRGRIDWLVEKATELGVDRLVPVITRRTVVDRLNLDRLRAHAIEAAEQCGILAIPEIAEPVKLDRLIWEWEHGRRLIFCDEGADSNNPAPALAAIEERRLGLLIGPEGGFSDEERRMLRALPYVTPIPLGPRILRADTAAVAALAVIQATIGDWR